MPRNRTLVYPLACDERRARRLRREPRPFVDSSLLSHTAALPLMLAAVQLALSRFERRGKGAGARVRRTRRRLCSPTTPETLSALPQDKVFLGAIRLKDAILAFGKITRPTRRNRTLPNPIPREDPSRTSPDAPPTSTACFGPLNLSLGKCF